jgi:glutamate/tyrosine decarboxylase-like PLP-dependent enzyme
MDDRFMDEILRKTFDLAQRLIESETREPVTRYRSPAELTADLDLSLRREGESLDEVFRQLGLILDATPKTASRRFFNQLFAGRDPAATAAEMLTPLLNTSMYTFKIAGPHALIELELTRHMVRKVDYPSGEGVFTPGGSMSNLVAMVVARNEVAPRFRNEGHAVGTLTAYTSDQAHYSIVKNAGMIGTGRTNVRRIASDSRGRMRPEALREAIRLDLTADRVPYIVVATAGTTVLGAFDPIEDIAEIASEFGIWFHIDGALGGSVLLCEGHREALRGSERSDSFSWNPHKLMGVPLLCSAILVRQPGLLCTHFKEAASYLFQSGEEDFDLGTRSMQCGRRNDALKLWAAWKHHGDDGFGRRIGRLYDLARYAADIVETDPTLVLTKEPESVIVCFEVEGRPSNEICDVLRRQGSMLVGYGIVDGRCVIRLAVANPDLTADDIDLFFREVRAAAAAIGSGSTTVAPEDGVTCGQPAVR